MPDGSRREYRLGESFGIEPRLEPQLHRGVMRTLVDDCQFVLVAQVCEFHCSSVLKMLMVVQLKNELQSINLHYFKEHYEFYW